MNTLETIIAPESTLRIKEREFIYPTWVEIIIFPEGLKKSDEAWLVVDKDQWTDEQLSQLHQWSLKAKNYGFALSNPKFEFWLLLHFEDGSGVSSSQICSQKLELDEKARYGEDDRANHVVGFIERYQVRFENENTMEPVSAGRLLATLRRVGREFNLEFEYKKPAQLGRRISNNLDVIRDAGFDIDRQRNAHTKNFEYRISSKGV